MRTNNAIKNAISSIIMSIGMILIGFVSQKIFIITLGTEYLGLNGLFNNILSILSVAELGFGSAIVYNLYKPIADNDISKINILLNFYKKTYWIIASIILLFGLLITPFLNLIIGITTIENIHLLFILSLLDIIASYLLTYKRSILYASQKNYIINFVHLACVLLLNTLQIIFLLFTKNYIIYLVLKIILRLIENIVITDIANKKYPYIKEATNKSLDIETKNDIFKKVKGLMLHNVASAVVQGTDNIIISKMFGVMTVGLYSNYYLIISALNGLITQMFQSLTATVGNLLIENDHNKSYFIYKKIHFLNSLIYCTASICILCIIESFIKLWLGEEFLLSHQVLIVIIVNFYIQGMRKVNSIFKNAAGIFYEDRYIPLIESIINIIFSILLAKKFGLLGVFLGTIFSSSVLYFYTYPVLIYKKMFKMKYREFFIDMVKPVFLLILSFISTQMIINFISFSNEIVEMMIRIVISFVIVGILHMIVYYKSGEVKYYFNIIKGLIKKYEKKKY